mmetsp:Transcript_37818/g.61275  ORF Transcript_37818/g.61275 Transcript_37818/m.61275 type:complete len:333 (-) Transcript_37818:4999-5997(-)
MVTASPKLCLELKKQYRRLLRSLSSGASTDDDNNDTELADDVPECMGDVTTAHSPLIITYGTLLLMLDGCFKEKFFKADEEGPRSAVGGRYSLKRDEVTWKVFAEEYWPCFPQSLTKNKDASLVYTEFLSWIEGSKEALLNGGPVSCDAFVTKFKRQHRNSFTTEKQQREVYALYEQYRAMKKQRWQFDMSDAAHYIYNQMKAYRGPLVDFVYVDEVQDLTAVQLAVFTRLCLNPKSGFMFAGDTAQTIAQGVGFRFADVRALFYDFFLTEPTTKSGSDVPDMHFLTQNFRTHSGVLNVASALTDEIITSSLMPLTMLSTSKHSWQGSALCL